MTRPQMVLVCQSADTRLSGEDGDHVGTMKLSEIELRRILEHGRHFPFLTPKERDEVDNGHWRTRMWETSVIEIWGTTRDLGFPVSKDKDLVRSPRDADEDRRINLVISPEILSFCRRKIEERDQEEEPDLCTRAKNQWVTRCLGGSEGPLDRQETVGRGKRWEATSTPHCSDGHKRRDDLP
jgi:hypothetical protein